VGRDAALEGAAKEILANGFDDAGVAADIAAPIPTPAAAAKGERGDCADPTPPVTGSRLTLMILERKGSEYEREKQIVA
jgi:hypothetical protein